MQYTIRLTREDDCSKLIAVEQACNTMFDAFGLFFDSEQVMSEEMHRIHQQDGRSWVAVDELDQPVGFAVACEVEGDGHLEVLGVHPDHGRHGIGRALVETVCAWVSARGYPALTLTTERDIPWNAPFYAKLGFEMVPPEEWTDAQHRIFETEAAMSNPQNRVLMRRKLTSGTESA
jgi:GNAT superfamily N-acetyltransferase